MNKKEVIKATLKLCFKVHSLKTFLTNDIIIMTFPCDEPGCSYTSFSFQEHTEHARVHKCEFTLIILNKFECNIKFLLFQLKMTQAWHAHVRPVTKNSTVMKNFGSTVKNIF